MCKVLLATTNASYKAVKSTHCRCRDKAENQDCKMRAGADYQAELPACACKPLPGSQPTAEEAHWLEHFVMSAGSFGDPHQSVPIRLVKEVTSSQRY